MWIKLRLKLCFKIFECVYTNLGLHQLCNAVMNINSVDKNKTLPQIVFYNISMFFTNLGIHQLCNTDEYKFYKTGIKTCNQDPCKHVSAWNNNSIFVYFYWRELIVVRYRVSYCQDIWQGQILICKFLRYEKHNFLTNQTNKKIFLWIRSPFQI